MRSFTPRQFADQLRQPWLIFALSYLLLVFPFCYFRHDDWLILGNAVLILPHDWHFLWKPTLFYGGMETTWFFRPFFKLIVYIFYHLFGLNYYLWLTALLGMALGMMAFAKLAIDELTEDPNRSALTVAFFAAYVPLHFGSLAWMGEGCMNLPQGFLLAANTYFFLRFLRSRSPRDFALALATFLISLGFKESSAAHPFFLLLLMVTHRRTRRSDWLALFPFATAAGIYVYFRLHLVPINPAYLPKINARSVIKPSLILAAIFLLPWLAMVITQPARLKPLAQEMKKKWPLLLFFIPCVAPYFGHGFFSPGWLFLPGFYLALCFGLWMPTVGKTTRFKTAEFAGALAVLSSIPVVVFLHNVGWWQWSAGQHEIVSIVKNAPRTYTKWVIEDCGNDENESVDMGRVIGFSQGLTFLWELEHGSKAELRVVPCGTRTPSSVEETALHLTWKFPHVSITPPPTR